MALLWACWVIFLVITWVLEWLPFSSGSARLKLCSLIYGKYAIVSAISSSMNAGEKSHLVQQNTANLEEMRKREVDRVLKKWRKFESFAKKDRKTQNAEYYSGGSFDHDNYYKGATLSKDIKEFTW